MLKLTRKHNTDIRKGKVSRYMETMLKESVSTTKLFWKEAWKRAVDTLKGRYAQDGTSATFTVLNRRNQAIPMTITVLPDFTRDEEIGLTEPRYESVDPKTISLYSIKKNADDLEIDELYSYYKSEHYVLDLVDYAEFNFDSFDTSITEGMVDRVAYDPDSMEDCLEAAVELIAESIESSYDEACNWFYEATSKIEVDIAIRFQEETGYDIDLFDESFNLRKTSKRRLAKLESILSKESNTSSSVLSEQVVDMLSLDFGDIDDYIDTMGHRWWQDCSRRVSNNSNKLVRSIGRGEATLLQIFNILNDIKEDLQMMNREMDRQHKRDVPKGDELSMIRRMCGEGLNDVIDLIYQCRQEDPNLRR